MARWSHWSLLMSISVKGKLQISPSTASTEATLWQHLGWEPTTEGHLWWRPVLKVGLCIWNLPGGQLDWEMSPPAWHSSSVEWVHTKCIPMFHMHVILMVRIIDRWLSQVLLLFLQMIYCVTLSKMLNKPFLAKWGGLSLRGDHGTESTIATLRLFLREGKMTMAHIEVKKVWIWFTYLLYNSRVKYLKNKIENNWKIWVMIKEDQLKLRGKLFSKEETWGRSMSNYVGESLQWSGVDLKGCWYLM